MHSMRIALCNIRFYKTVTLIAVGEFVKESLLKLTTSVTCQTCFFFFFYFLPEFRFEHDYDDLLLFTFRNLSITHQKQFLAK